MICLISSDYELSKLFDWLEPNEILAVSAVNRVCHQAAEEWCRTEGLSKQVTVKRAEIEGISDIIQQMQHEHKLIAHDPLYFYGNWTSPPDLPNGLELLFESYHGFLQALLSTPLSDTVVNLSSWKERYTIVTRPRPPAIRQKFDFGYPDAGYWCDTFGCGAPNDYFRLVGDSPNEYWSLCLAGSDAHHIRWRNASNEDRSLDPVPGVRLKTKNAAGISYIQTSDELTEWDEIRTYWRKCGARVEKKIWRID
jgi:hypothetical protein